MWWALITFSADFKRQDFQLFGVVTVNLSYLNIERKDFQRTGSSVPLRVSCVFWDWSDKCCVYFNYAKITQFLLIISKTIMDKQS